jgi:hypothetical protein
LAYALYSGFKFAVHPGTVISTMDWNIHYHDYATLIQLYAVPITRCILWDDSSPDTYRGRFFSSYVHLYPISADDHDVVLKSKIKKYNKRNGRKWND